MRNWHVLLRYFVKVVSAAIVAIHEVTHQLVTKKIVVLPKVFVSTAFFETEESAIELPGKLEVVYRDSEMKWLNTHNVL